MLNGSDIRFVAEAPEDITLKELLVQVDKIEPRWGSCGLRSCPDKSAETEIFITKKIFSWQAMMCRQI